jgi:hypothetical protein
MRRIDMVTLTKKQALTAIIWVRFIVGGFSWFFPKAMAEIMLIDPEANPALSYGLRLFGVRDVLMGILLQDFKGDALDRQLQIGVAIDLIDVTASGLAGLTGQIPKRAAILCCCAGLVGASLGAASLGKGPLSKKTIAH